VCYVMIDPCSIILGNNFTWTNRYRIVQNIWGIKLSRWHCFVGIRRKSFAVIPFHKCKLHNSTHNLWENIHCLAINCENRESFALRIFCAITGKQHPLHKCSRMLPFYILTCHCIQNPLKHSMGHPFTLSWD